MKRFALYTNTISPHQLPLAKELAARVGDDNFRYIYTEVADKDHGALGWSLDVPQWCIHVSDVDADEWLENADTLLSGLRCFDLFESRAKQELKNFYMTERWFKPPIGMLRLLHPRYFGYARRLCQLLESGTVIGLPIGIHAARDMARLCGLVHGDLRCLFRAPQIEFERKPGGRIAVSGSQLAVSAQRYCLDKMRLWGYFVEPSKFSKNTNEQHPTTNSQLTTLNSQLEALRVLWVGRLLSWKRVYTIIRAVGESKNAVLDIYGTGPMEVSLKKMAVRYGDLIRFHPPVPIDDVRKLMRSHDVYVMASNTYEGWGAVVNEALEEGMKVIGTYEAGSSDTILPESILFHSGDWNGLIKVLQKDIPRVGIGDWSAKCAAKTLMV